MFSHCSEGYLYQGDVTRVQVRPPFISPMPREHWNQNQLQITLPPVSPFLDLFTPQGGPEVLINNFHIVKTPIWLTSRPFLASEILLWFLLSENNHSFSVSWKKFVFSSLHNAILHKEKWENMSEYLWTVEVVQHYKRKKLLFFENPLFLSFFSMKNVYLPINLSVLCRVWTGQSKTIPEY